MDIRYSILKDRAECLIRRIDALEKKEVDNEYKLTFDVHEEIDDMIAFYKTELKR